MFDLHKPTSFRLSRTLGRDLDVEPADVINTKSALGALGHFNTADGDLPRLFADALQTGSRKSIHEYADFLRQMQEISADFAAKWRGIRCEGFWFRKID